MKLWLVTKTARQWARDLVAMGYAPAALDRALTLIMRQGWLSKSQRNKLRRLFRHEARVKEEMRHDSV